MRRPGEVPVRHGRQCSPPSSPSSGSTEKLPQGSPLWFVQVRSEKNSRNSLRRVSRDDLTRASTMVLPGDNEEQGLNRHRLDLLAVRVHLGEGRGRGLAVAHRDSLVGALRPALLAAQLFALLPVDGASAVVSPVAPAFRWRSPRIFYTLFVSSGTVVVAFLAAYHAIATGLSFRSSVDVVFFGNSVCAMLLFLQLATRWPSLSRTWAKTESTMRQYGYPRHLGRKAYLLTAAVLLLATGMFSVSSSLSIGLSFYKNTLFAVEHILAVMTGVLRSWPCYVNGGFPGLMRGYTIHNFAMVVHVTPYAHWKGIAVFILNVVATFSWNYTDLFIMLLSVALAQRFQLLNHRLRTLQGKKLSSSMWRQLRETYNSLVSLTKTVDCCISSIVLLSFANNLYFICIQLLQGIKPIQDFYQYAYYFYSFGYLLVRTCVTSLCAASIHDHSREPKTILYAVPSESYCVEVKRFLQQVSTDEVALTGCSFFAVTRSLMLTVAGTIVTYEIVLVQFGTVGDNYGNVTHSALSNNVGMTDNKTTQCF